MTATVGKYIRLAPQVVLKHAIFELLICVVTISRAVDPEMAEYAVIQGCRPMCLWCIQALKGNLLSVLIALSVSEERLTLFGKFGAKYMLNPKKLYIEQQIDEITDGHMPDFVIDGTGVPRLLNLAQR